MRIKIQKVILLIIMGVTIVSGMVTSFSSPLIDVWDEGDWITYEMTALISLKRRYIVTAISPDYIEFTTSHNTSITRKMNTTTGQWFDVPSSQNQTDDDFFAINFYPELANIENETGGSRFNYETHDVVKIDGVPILIPVLGSLIEYSNYTKLEVYNDSTGLNDTVIQQTNNSIRIEIHEQTGIMINMAVACYTNYTSNFWGITGIGASFHVLDSHGIFEDESDKSSQASTTGFIFSVSLISVIYLIRRKKKRGMKSLDIGVN